VSGLSRFWVARSDNVNGSMTSMNGSEDADEDQGRIGKESLRSDCGERAPWQQILGRRELSYAPQTFPHMAERSSLSAAIQ